MWWVMGHFLGGSVGHGSQAVTHCLLWCSLWKDVPLRNFLTYMDVFAWKFSYGSACLYTTCYQISYVCARPTCFHTACRLPDVFTHGWTRTWTRLVVDTFVCKRGVRDKTKEILWHVAHRHVLLCDNLQRRCPCKSKESQYDVVTTDRRAVVRGYIRQNDLGGRVTFDKQRDLGI